MSAINKVQMINIEQLYPHPDNPRKNVGDVTELAESIQKNGIMQNLTVVPNDSPKYTYTVVIGHRRLAAAKEAGLKQLPCVVSDMSEREQIAIMLAENMQRSDLTVQEEAQGFQLLLDMGSTIDQVSKDTSISKTTVRRRIKLMELDQDALSKCINDNNGQISLKDLDLLEKVKDIKQKNKLLDKIGKETFSYEIRRVLDSQKLEENKKMFTNLLSGSEKCQATSQIDYSKFQYGRAFYFSNNSSEDLKNYIDSAEGSIAYKVTSYGVELYTSKKESDTAAAEEQQRKNAEKQQLINKIKEQSKEIAKRAYESRMDFVKNIPVSLIKKNLKALAAAIYTSDIIDFDEDIMQLFDSPAQEAEEQDDCVLNLIEEQPEKALLYLVFLIVDGGLFSCISWNGKYEKNEQLEYAYDFLSAFGYKMSEEEQTYVDGTHEMYVQEDQE